MSVEHYKYQNNVDDFRVQYDVCMPHQETTVTDTDAEFDKKVAEFLKEYEETKEEIERLTNTADGVDYAIAVSCGIIAGLIDVFFVGEWDFCRAKAFSNRRMNEKVQAFARKNGLEKWVRDINAKGIGKMKDPNRLETAVEFLEIKFPLPGDNTWSGVADRVSTKSHHLDDLAHHPTIVGLIYSIMAQYTQTATYVSRSNSVTVIPIVVDENGWLEGKTPSAKISSGIINWSIGVARNRKGHLFSDMAGSKATAGRGMGLPGTLLSTLKELSMIPGIDNPDFSEKLYRAYANGIGEGKNQVDLGALNSLFAGADSKLDMRTEHAIGHELKRQAVPVVINEILVRSLYFIRHLTLELKQTGDIETVNWKKIIPFRNRTIVRMMTIASGTFVAIDLADAAIRAAIKSGMNPEAFMAHFVLRVNFVGIGRFSIACATDVMMGVKKNRLELAMASAVIAKGAVDTVRTIDEIEKRQKRTAEHLDEMEAVVNSVAELRF